MQLFGFDTDRAFEYENGFYLTSQPQRLGKLLAHYELYKRIIGLPGHVVELGVFKGASFVRWAGFRSLLESPHSRKLIGFDIFGSFPQQPNERDEDYARRHDQNAGTGISPQDLRAYLAHKGQDHDVELVGGNILETVPAYVQAHPELKISLLHIDVDVYQPALTALEHLYPCLVPGGLLVLDDYATVAGETHAVDHYFAAQGISAQFEKLPLAHIPVYVVKS